MPGPSIMPDLSARVVALEQVTRTVKSQLEQDRPIAKEVMIDYLQALITTLHDTQQRLTPLESWDEMSQAAREVDANLAAVAAAAIRDSLTQNSDSTTLPPPYSERGTEFSESTPAASAPTTAPATYHQASAGERAVYVTLSSKDAHIWTHINNQTPARTCAEIQSLLNSHPHPALAAVQLESCAISNSGLVLVANTVQEVKVLEFLADDWSGIFGKGTTIQRRMALMSGARPGAGQGSGVRYVAANSRVSGLASRGYGVVS